MEINLQPIITLTVLLICGAILWVVFAPIVGPMFSTAWPGIVEAWHDFATPEPTPNQKREERLAVKIDRLLDENKRNALMESHRAGECPACRLPIRAAAKFCHQCAAARAS
jgi:hypothetical protein